MIGPLRTDPDSDGEMVIETIRGDRGKHQPHKVAASGWIGSALEYYDFFIYATAATIVFPQTFFPTGNPQTAIIFSLATFGVGYIARPIGAIVLGHWGDTHGRKNVLLLCMFLMGFATLGVGLLPTFDQVGLLAPIMLVVLRLIQGFAVAGEISGASSMILEHAPFGRRAFFSSFTAQGVQAGQLLAAAVFLPLATFMPKDAFLSWGWRIPFLLSIFVVLAGWIIRRKVQETPAFTEEVSEHAIPRAPILEAIRTSWRDLIRVILTSLMYTIAVVTTVFGAAYAVQPAYGNGFDPQVYLWIPLLGNVAAVIVIPFIGKLADKIGRRPPIIAGCLGSGALAFFYLHAISIGNVTLAIVTAVLMWGVLYLGYGAVFPSFYPEMFPTRTRVSAMAVGQNIGTTITALLPALFAVVAPPGSANIPLIVGGITFAISVIAAIATWSARETYRVRAEDPGDPTAVPVPKDEYDWVRAHATSG